MIKKVYAVAVSLRTTNILLATLIILHIIGAVVMPNSSSFNQINKMSLFQWIGKASLQDSWWIKGIIGVLGLLVINTIFCSIESILRKKEGRSPFLTISPQIIHMGFCFMLVAHMVSGISATREETAIREGYIFQLMTGEEVRLDKVHMNFEKGKIPDMSADITYKLLDGTIGTGTLSANHPVFVEKTGVYLKTATPYPTPQALLEFTYEPGAIWSLIGSIMFILGTFTFCIYRLREKD